MAVMFLVEFVVSPLSRTLIILEKQDWQFFWDLGRTIIIVSGLITIGILALDVYIAIIAYTLIMTVAFIILWIMSFVAVRHIQLDQVMKDNL